MYYAFGNHFYTFSSVPPMYSLSGRHISFFSFMPIYFNILEGRLGEWFHVRSEVRQGCLLSPTLFNMFLETIMTEALENHTGTVSIGQWNMSNLQFANDIDGFAGSEDELRQLLKHLEDTSQSYGMLINASKMKVMSNTTDGFIDKITINSETLEEVESFKHLGSIFSDKGSRPELLARIMMMSQTMARLKVVRYDRNISIAIKLKLLQTLVLPIFLYACETWTLTLDIQRRISTLEMKY